MALPWHGVGTAFILALTVRFVSTIAGLRTRLPLANFANSWRYCGEVGRKKCLDFRPSFCAYFWPATDMDFVHRAYDGTLAGALPCLETS